ncbi:MAG: recombinase family protein [Vulcanimicrobiaceae bacterium]
MPRKVRRTSLARFLLETQEERVRAYATAIGTCDEVVIDAGESAKTLKRPGLQRVLADVRCGTITTVIVVKLDRLTRSVRDLGEIVDLFERTGAALISVSEYLDTSSASGRLMMNLLGAVSQWKREAIGERTQAELAHKRRRRTVYGRTPFTYARVGEDLFEHPEE